MSDKKNKALDYRIPEGSSWASAWKIPAALAVVGLVLSGLGASSDLDRFGYSYLFAFFSVTTVVFGAMFLTIGLQLTGGIWGITSRRMPEIIAAGAVVIAVMGLPLIGGVNAGVFHMYDEWAAHSHHGDHGDDHGEHGDDHADHAEGEGEHHGSLELLGASTALAQHGDDHGEGEHEAGHAHTPQMEAQHHAIIEGKSGYLNMGGWTIRAIVYLVIWVLIGLFYFVNSTKQDETKDWRLTAKMKGGSPLAAIAFGLTLTFASFDWLMSLEPAWYSTIFGVVIFGGSAVAIFAVMIILGIGLYRAGHVGNAINTEHFHDLGKFLFAFMSFWAYVSFSQWMLIWYAGIPEEATWFHKRWENGWDAWALFLMIGHFVLPFYFLISRLTKRNLTALRFGAVWLLLMHIADIYMMVLPQARIHLGDGMLYDAGALLFLGGVFFTFVLLMMKKFPLIPVGDPRLQRSIHHHQTH